MSIRNYLLFVVAILSGVGALGCWVLTQADAAITPKEGPIVVLLMVGCILLFGMTLFLSAFFATRGRGTLAVIRRTMFLVGLVGIVVLFFFVVTSWGRIFFFGPTPTVLLAIFVLLALVFRPRRIAEHDPN
jgi:peptidoglycan/LPS O-acetylase OafA/YrhL